jgi:hypothetical protein
VIEEGDTRGMILCRTFWIEAAQPYRSASLVWGTVRAALLLNAMLQLSQDVWSSVSRRCNRPRRTNPRPSCDRRAAPMALILVTPVRLLGDGLAACFARREGVSLGPVLATSMACAMRCRCSRSC